MRGRWSCRFGQIADSHFLLNRHLERAQLDLNTASRCRNIMPFTVKSVKDTMYVCAMHAMHNKRSETYLTSAYPGHHRPGFRLRLPSPMLRSLTLALAPFLFPIRFSFSFALMMRSASAIRSVPTRQLLSTTPCSDKTCSARAHRCRHIASRLLTYCPSAVWPWPPPLRPSVLPVLVRLSFSR